MNKPGQMGGFGAHFTALVERIESGAVTHEDYAGMLLDAAHLVGLTKSRDELLAELYERYPTQEALVAHLQAMLSSYLQASPKPHSLYDEP